MRLVGLLAGVALIAIFALMMFTTFVASIMPVVSSPGTAGGTGGVTTLPPGLSLTMPYVRLAWDDALQVGIPPATFVRQINQESGFRPDALSPAGAEGIAQFMPATAAALGVDPWNPVSALAGAARLMANLVHSYQAEYAKALAAYNAGSGAVDACVRLVQAAWLSCMPTETQQYVHVILQ
jgi:soluble lytic murein transglycosylase-like protein